MRIESTLIYQENSPTGIDNVLIENVEVTSFTPGSGSLHDFIQVTAKHVFCLKNVYITNGSSNGAFIDLENSGWDANISVIKLEVMYSSFDSDFMYIGLMSGLIFENVTLIDVSARDNYGIYSDGGFSNDIVRFNNIVIEDVRFYYGFIDLYSSMRSFIFTNVTTNFLLVTAVKKNLFTFKMIFFGDVKIKDLNLIDTRINGNFFRCQNIDGAVTFKNIFMDSMTSFSNSFIYLLLFIWLYKSSNFEHRNKSLEIWLNR